MKSKFRIKLICYYKVLLYRMKSKLLL